MVDYKKYELNRFLSTSNVELIDIGKAWFAISIAFGLVLGGLKLLFFRAFFISAIAVGLGFLLHELSHKVIAQKYGLKAEFRSFDEMLFLAVIMSFFGFVIAAPGAVMIKTIKFNEKQNGRISVAGPLTNLVLALFFFLIIILIDGRELMNTSLNNIVNVSLLYSIPIVGFLINSWLALFNMIPVWQFDGAKVFRWNKVVYFLVVIVAAFFVFVL